MNQIVRRNRPQQGDAPATAAADAKAPARRDPSALPPEPDANPSRTQPTPKILLVEDNAMNRTFMASLLKSRGIEATTAGNGLEALERLRSDSFDIILMDMLMPVMDGLEATRRIRAGEAGRADTPIIAMTAFAMGEERDNFLRAGADDYVSKPIEPDALFLALKRAAGRGRGPRPDLPDAPTVAPDLAELPVLDTEGALTRLHGNFELLLKMYICFRDECPARLEQLKGVAASGDREAARSLAHAFANSSGVIGAERLLILSRWLQRMAKGQEDLRELASKVVCELERVLRSIEDYIHAGNAGSDEG